MQIIQNIFNNHNSILQAMFFTILCAIDDRELKKYSELVQDL